MNAYLAECLGTSLLLLMGNGVVANVVLGKTKGQGAGWIVIAGGWGIAVFVAVAFADQYSGAHLNPAVTVALAAAGLFDAGQVPGYIAAQLTGAMLGTTLAWLAYYRHYAATDDPALKLATFCTAPAIRSPGWNTTTEAIGTFVLISCVLYFGTPELVLDESLPSAKIGLGSIGAIPVGLVVFGIGLSLGGPTGYAINPARDLGPRIMHALLPIPGKGGSDWGYAWVPVVGPLLGGLVATCGKLVFG